jgi:predicted DCC family thiol-disulfide oxidoreductase YuxK
MAERAACYAFPRVAQGETTTEMLFYDGHCGLCHGFVKFVLKRDRAGRAFRFAPLQGPTFEARVPKERCANLPDSILVLTNEGALLARSDAVVHVLRRLGGGWKVAAGALGLVPRGLRDAGYNFVARIRYGIFGKRDDLCPVTPPDLRARFDA